MTIRKKPPLFILIPALVAGISMLLPLFYLGLRAFEADLDVVQSLVLRPRTLNLLTNTLLLTFGVLVATTLMALPLAWLVVCSDIRYKRLLTLLGALPLAIPGYVMAYALLGIGGHYGFMARVFDYPVPRLQGYWGALIALSLYTFPYLFLNLRAALAGLDPSLQESARSLGHTGRQTFWRVTLPHLRPALLAGWLVIALYVLGDFGAVALMRYEVFSYAIFTQYSGAFDRIYAAWLSLLLLGLTLSFILTESLLLGSRRLARTGTGAARGVTPVALGWYRLPAYLFLLLLFGAALGLPALIIGYWLSLAPLLTDYGPLLAAFLRSAGAAAPAALVAALFALPIAYLSVRYPSPLARTLDRLAYIGYAIPPLTLALALVFFSLRSAPWLYQTLPLLVIAYALSFLALALGPIRSSLLQARPSLEEAARSLGRSAFGAFTSTSLPLLRRGTLAGMTLVFVIAMKELPITFLLAPTGYTTLAVSVFGRTSEAMLAEAAPFAAAIVLFSSLFIGLILTYEGKQ